jgi:tetratricopeptide (TPR) repeat protein
MPQMEVEDSRDLYHWLNEDDEKQTALVDAFNKAGAYAYIQPDPSKLTRAQVDAEIPLIQDCLRLVSEKMQGLAEIASVHVDFSPGPSNAERLALQRKISLHPDKDFPEAFAFFRNDLDNAHALMRADQPALEFVQETTEHGASHLPEVYEQIHAKYPNFKPGENVVIGFGYIALRHNDLSGAINVFKFSAKLYPDSWNVYDSLGEAYAKAGKKKLAVENYQHALKLNPSAQSSIDALAKLQR